MNRYEYIATVRSRMERQDDPLYMRLKTRRFVAVGSRSVSSDEAFKRCVIKCF